MTVQRQATPSTYYSGWRDHLGLMDWRPMKGARPIVIAGFESLHFCIWKEVHHDWQIIEATSGWIVAQSDTRQQAAAEAKRLMQGVGLARVQQRIAAAIQYTGPSPWRPEGEG